MYFALSENYVQWEAVANEIINVCNSESKIIVEENGWGEPIVFDASAIKKDFNLEFDSWLKLKKHINFLVNHLQTN